MYHGLCHVARENGYALAVHGSVTTDFDLVAIPWVNDCADGETLKDKLMAHILACGYDDLLRRDGLPEEMVRQIIARKEPGTENEGTVKPHGRLAWNLYLYGGSKVDLSVMPRISP